MIYGDIGRGITEGINPSQGNREFPFWKRKIPQKKKIPENTRLVKCLILHALTQ